VPCERCERLERALRTLVANVRGLIGIERDGIVGLVGYTNVACVESNLLDADAALATPDAPQCLCHIGWRHCSIHQDDGREPPAPCVGTEEPKPRRLRDVLDKHGIKVDPSSAEVDRLTGKRLGTEEPVPTAFSWTDERFKAALAKLSEPEPKREEE